MTESRSTTVRFLANALVFGLAIHILIGLYFIFSPAKGTSSFEKLYRTKFLIGPFFTEERITFSPSLRVRYKLGGEWSPWRDYAHENIQAFRGSPWKYGTLKRNDYLKFQIWQCYGSLGHDTTFGSVRQSPAFENLNRYLLNELLPAQVDTVQLTYVFRRYQPDVKSVKEDVVLNLTYNPDDVTRP